MKATKTTRAQKAYEKAQEMFADHILGLISSIEDKMVALQSIRDTLDSIEYDSRQLQWAKKLNWSDTGWDDIVRDLQEEHGKVCGMRDDFDDFDDIGDAIAHEVAELNAEANTLRLLADKVGDKK